MTSKKNNRKSTRSTVATTKAAPRKREAVSPAVASSTTVTERPSTLHASSRKIPKINKKYLTIGLSLLLLAGLIYLLRSFFVAALVNGQPISRISVVSELERQSGKQALDTLVTKTLILQEAKKQNITVNQDEINAEVKKIENNVKKQGQTLEQVLALQGMDRAGLINQIEIQKTVEKILGKDISVSDKEVQDYIATNKEALGADPESNESKTKVKEQLTQQKLSEKFQTWLQNLQKKAKIDYFVSY